jgi:hypothetical protein
LFFQINLALRLILSLNFQCHEFSTVFRCHHPLYVDPSPAYSCRESYFCSVGSVRSSCCLSVVSVLAAPYFKYFIVGTYAGKRVRDERSSIM